MFPASSLSGVLFARLDERVDWLEALPLLFRVPLKWLRLNYRFYQAVRYLRGTVRLMATLLEERAGEQRFSKLSLADRQNWAELCLQNARSGRVGLAQIRSSENRGIYFGPLVAWMDKTVDDFSDLAIVFGLGADPEMDRLAKELADAL